MNFTFQESESTFQELRERPTLIGMGIDELRVHESCFRSYGCLMKVVALIRAGTPGCVMLELIDDVMDAPPVTQEVGG